MSLSGAGVGRAGASASASAAAATAGGRGGGAGRGGAGGRGRLTNALDRDVLAVAQKFLDDEASPIPRVSEVYSHIMRSNSALKRRPRKQLEASLERVLDILRQDREDGFDSDIDGDGDGGSSSGSGGGAVMDTIEGDFADGYGPRATSAAEAASADARGLNKGLTRLWSTNGTTTTTAASKGPTTSAKNGGRGIGEDGREASAPAPRLANEGTRKASKRSAQEPAAKRQKLDVDHSPPDYASFEQLGGIQRVREQLEDLLVLPLLRPDVYDGAAFEPPRGILLHGPPGCGKTAVANAIAAEIRVPFISISGPSIVSGMSGESERALRDHFEEAKKIAPCIIFIDEIDAITPKRESAQRQMETRIVAQLLTCMDDIALQKTGGKVVVVIAATNRPDSLDPALRRGGRFDTEINMPIPDEATRKSILTTLTKPLPLDGDLQLDLLAKRTAGFVGADLKDLVNRSAQMALKRFRLSLFNDDAEMQVDGGEVAAESSSLSTPSDLVLFRKRIEQVRASREVPSSISVNQHDFDIALPMIQPSLKREGFATVPDTTWKNIGALASIREQLMVSIVTPILRPDLYKAVGLTAPAGVLLWGPPGCGKTLLAKAVANESMANFISVKGPELMNKYVGESEREVRLLFTRARSSVPCVIFFDELDALAPRRGREMTESSARVVNTLLTEMDGLDKREGVYVIGATNRPDVIDPAMLRPGRLETPLFVDLPGPEERVDILRTQCQTAGAAFSDEIGAIARDSCDRFSGADLEALRRAAAFEAIKRGSTTGVELADWLRAAHLVKPSVDPKAARVFQRLLRTFGNAVIGDTDDNNNNAAADNLNDDNHDDRNANDTARRPPVQKDA